MFTVTCYPLETQKRGQASLIAPGGNPMFDMRRREFIALLGSGIATWPLATRAQQPAMPMVGLLSPSSADGSLYLTEALRRGLAEVGYIEGSNVLIEYRWADGHYD